MTDEDTNKLRSLIKEELAVSEKRIIGEIGTFMEDHLFPMLEEKADKSDIDRLQGSIDSFGDKNSDISARVSDIETIPVIAHELKIKRAK